jgi:hypothetical protein
VTVPGASGSASASSEIGQEWYRGLWLDTYHTTTTGVARTLTVFPTGTALRVAGLRDCRSVGVLAGCSVVRRSFGDHVHLVYVSSTTCLGTRAPSAPRAVADSPPFTLTVDCAAGHHVARRRSHSPIDDGTGLPTWGGSCLVHVHRGSDTLIACFGAGPRGHPSPSTVLWWRVSTFQEVGCNSSAHLWRCTVTVHVAVPRARGTAVAWIVRWIGDVPALTETYDP